MDARLTVAEVFEMLGAPQEIALIIDDIGPRVSSKRLCASVFVLFCTSTATELKSTWRSP